ncbi:MAG TPA: hypothetical protein VFU37_02405, partial [Pyrinomonadaceae bacterium]|nr:hypothetical protein [Pyrinomonadaceae bacterium]
MTAETGSIRTASSAMQIELHVPYKSTTGIADPQRMSTVPRTPSRSRRAVMAVALRPSVGDQSTHARAIARDHQRSKPARTAPPAVPRAAAKTRWSVATTCAPSVMLCDGRQDNQRCVAL